jgi:hypothetical protein
MQTRRIAAQLRFKEPWSTAIGLPSIVVNHKNDELGHLFVV